MPLPTTQEVQPTMKSMLVRIVAVLLLGLIPAAGLVTPASAASRAALTDAATRVAFEPVTGGEFSKYRKIYPTELNWSNDGCSVPKAIILVSPALALVINHYGSVFRDSCVRHDFGYRNFGSNTAGQGPHPKLGANAATKARIDSTFYSNMKIQCAAKYHNWATKKACNSAASVFYTAVSKGGNSSFFG